MVAKQKLELTWIGKENRPRREPRILLEDPTNSYHSTHRVNENDNFDNRLIFGDNLLALKALEQEFTGRLKCVFIDPPYNTGAAFEQYDDGIEHSLWLSLMRDRLQILKTLLRDDGSIWISIDDRESHYLKILCDEVFGRSNFIANTVWQSKDTPGNNSSGIAQTHNHILAFRKTDAFRPAMLDRNQKQLATYTNPDSDSRGPWLPTPLTRAEHRDRDYYAIPNKTGRMTFPPKGSSWRRPPAKMKLLAAENRIWWGKGGDADFPMEKKFLSEVKEGVVNQTWWPYEFAGSTRNASAEMKGLFEGSKAFDTPKPEKLLYRVLSLATVEGDWVLDSFAGSGTTGAVAHKMGRKWIMVELGEHCHNLIIPRLRKVIDGTDNVGVSTDEQLVWETQLTVPKVINGKQLLEQMREAAKQEESEYKGFLPRVEKDYLRLYGITSSEARNIGGGCRYYRIAPSLLERDEFGNWVINKRFNPEMLAEAMCKLEGFSYAPSKDFYWQHGHSTETDFIYVTTQTLTREQLLKLSDQVGGKRSLLVCCGAFRKSNLEDLANLTLKKIPRAVMDKCEWGKDDYSLEIKALPLAPRTTVESAISGSDHAIGSRKARKGKCSNQPKLFDQKDVE